MIRCVRRRLDTDDGLALVTVLLFMLVFLGLTVLLFATSLNDIRKTGVHERRGASFQAAEAAVNDYVAKLTEDHLYFAHFVHPAESSRLAPSGQTFQAGSTWTADLLWTYPNGRDAWRPLTNGYEYNLEIVPPDAGNVAVTIRATGRKRSTGADVQRIETQVRPASIADFQMIANRDIGYGSSATTRGSLYAGIDENGVRHSIAHAGHAYQNLYAENNITTVPTYHDGARGYTSSTIRTVVKNPINFASFTGSLVDIQRYATSSGILLSNAGIDGWRLEFESGGTVRISRCTRNGSNLTLNAPTCTVQETRALPTIGAIYSAQSIIVMGNVRGRVTVASNADIVIGDNISYVQSGRDVLGLIARNEMIVAHWCPTNLNWSAATLAQTGQWRSYNSDRSKGTMTFTGSTATNLGGFMDMFNVRNYNYDVTLRYLQPPFFPVLEEAYTTLFFRELAPN